MAKPPSSQQTPDIRDDSLNTTPATRTRSLDLWSNPEEISEETPIQNVFSDEFSVEPLDGFNSTRSSLSETTPRNIPPMPSSEETAPPIVSPFGDNADILLTEMIPVPDVPSNSDKIRHGPRERNSIARPLSTSSGNSVDPYSARRSISTSSRFSMPRPMSPYRGQTGPSQPYAMYPQGIGVTRTLSTSTVSTFRPPERSFIAAAPPQHPYAMYSQNTVPEEAVDEPQNPVIPIGFSSQSRGYQLPTSHTPNEVGDIVGPDGHTEQLPPYSRYPASPPSKQELLADDQNDAVPQPPVPEESPTPRRLTSEVSITDNTASTETDSSDHSSDSVKEKLSQKGQRKVCCGIPLWMFFLVAAVLLLGTIIGGVIGGLLGSQQTTKRNPPTTTSPTATVTVTAGTLDAIPGPTDLGVLPPLPTGKFVVPANTLQNYSSKCLSNGVYDSSWQCRTTGQFDCQIDVDKDDKATIILSSHNVTGSFFYGAQPPIFRDPDHTLSLMLDKTNISLGPAFFFYTQLDKLMIIPEDEFPKSPSKRGIDGASLSSRYWPGLRQKVAASPGDRPWFCWWNSTLLEAFIYVNETSSAAASSKLSTGAMPTQTSVPRAKRTFGTRNDIVIPEYSYYPRAIKIEEMRYASHGQPAYCEQMLVMDDRSLYRVSQDQIPILEAYTSTDAPFPSENSKSLARRNNFDEVGCFCQYFYV
ncbi:hypothetical protein LOZ12_000107 [Ophidiomyces ophidiicola]|uniref:Uncharacterized protein n=1 Tax=Ophidiomyces ophidiicola TaxID=1387563 RepID=A0ACB8V546_9EURO|nr:hypothetical protein LOZ64_000906 [Ophidiomyces ophidiicola]KAI1956101.1 hypothetical protein LOZ62_000093 [Ophidiomyces ophidiicola]KAI1967784.1 hypothetical protein LOZ59_000599 [Ophidiomyces ophidiicola]KAI1975235.1 hypothetical protein LOZ56_000759 [Ophidiomyces ophidiicola]KAI2007112.1 hypothetical protein LOZ50_002772 [Ophidiomyces ophidiicola]